MKNENELKVLNEKIESLKVSLSKKQNVELEKMSIAVDKSIYTLPRLKNYFTKLEKCFKLLVNKQKVFFALINYYVKNENVESSNVCYSLKKSFGKSIDDDTIIKVLKDGFEVLEHSRISKSINDYDFKV